MFLQNHQVVESKQVKCIALTTTPEHAGGGNERKFHYVVENKYRKNVSLWALHDVDENKRVIVVSPLC
jgi:hypothetical protein